MIKCVMNPANVRDVWPPEYPWSAGRHNNDSQKM